MNRCSSGGTIWLVSWPPIQRLSSVITTLHPARHAASAAAQPPVLPPTITTSAVSSRIGWTIASRPRRSLLHVAIRAPEGGSELVPVRPVRDLPDLDQSSPAVVRHRRADDERGAFGNVEKRGAMPVRCACAHDDVGL